MAGTALHHGIEQWELSGRTEDIALLVTLKYNEELDTARARVPDEKRWLRPFRWSPEATSQHYLDKAANSARAYVTEALSGQWQILELPDMSLALEVPFEIVLGEGEDSIFNPGVRVVGAVDVALEWESGEITVRDYKSGKKTPTPRQLGLYRLAMNELFGLNITRGDYWTGKDNSSTGLVDLTRYTREFLTVQYQALDRGVTEKVFLPNPGDGCTFCGVKSHCREMSTNTSLFLGSS